MTDEPGGNRQDLFGCRGFTGLSEALPTSHGVSHAWPAEERHELGSQIRRSSNSSPAQLAEKHDDRHVRNKVEGVNRSRGEAGETIHHLFMAKLKGYIQNDVYAKYRERYKQCLRMLNGLEKSLEQRLPEKERRWAVAEAAGEYSEPQELPNTEH